MKIAQSNIVVTLDGHGIDEELAGYHCFLDFTLKICTSMAGLVN
jgi:hypothetical protein